MAPVNNNNLCWDAINKEMYALDKPGVFQYYPPNKSLKIMMFYNGHQCRWFLISRNNILDANKGCSLYDMFWNNQNITPICLPSRTYMSG